MLLRLVVVSITFYCVVSPFFYRCIADGKYQQAIGMGIECRRLDKLEEAVIRSDNIHATINYCIDVSHNFVYRREYRLEVNSLRPFYFVSCQSFVVC